jgi:DNA-binding transcriptional MerR regulator
MAEAPRQATSDEANNDATGGYRGPQVCKIVGITYRQLDYWARTDLVRPSVCDANGSGTQRLYSYRDLVELKVVKRLLDAGISLQSARKAIEYLRTQLGADLASAHLVIDGANTVLAQTDDQIVDLLRAGQGVLNVVALGPVVSDLEAELHRFAPAEIEQSVAAHPSNTAVR